MILQTVWLVSNTADEIIQATAAPGQLKVLGYETFASRTLAEEYIVQRARVALADAKIWLRVAETRLRRCEGCFGKASKRRKRNA